MALPSFVPKADHTPKNLRRNFFTHNSKGYLYWQQYQPSIKNTLSETKICNFYP